MKAGKGEKILSVEEAVLKLQNEIQPIMDEEQIELINGNGRILAKDAFSPMDQPPFPRSPLDGYAIQGDDTKGAAKDHPVTLKVIGEICAGQVFSGIVESGEAVRIMTGAPVPCGADTVIKQENTDYGMDQVEIYESLKPYENYCFQGEDFQKGDLLLKKGTKLDGIGIGILASMGLSHVTVYRQPKIGIISTGDELITPGTEWRPGKIYDSNLYLLGGRLKELGLNPSFLLHCEDDADKLTGMIREKAKNADIILTTGGVSVGKKDILHDVIEKLGAKKLFWKVALKPGSPTLTAVYHNTLLICLSGNPFGAEANFELLVRPVIGTLSNDVIWKMKKIKAEFQGEFQKRSGRRRFLRGYYADGKVWIPEKKHASGVLSTMAGCNCLIDIEEGNEGLKKGDRIWIHLL